MRPDDEERELRESFAALREDDLRHTPSFEGLLARPVTRRRSTSPRWGPILAAAVTLALVTAAVLWRLPPPAEVDDDPAAVELLAWRAPTDVLLEIQGRDLLKEIPVLGGGGFLPPSADGRPAAGSANDRGE